MRDPNEQMQASWNANAEAWTRTVREGRIESRKVATDAAILGALSARPKRRLLDLGCGEGWLARELSALGFAVTGTDGSAPLVRAAQALGGGTFRTLTYEEIAGRPDLLQGPYAEIVCNFSLLGAELGALLQALRANLTADGRLYIQTLHPHAVTGGEPYRDGWRMETFAGMGESFPEPMPWYFRTVSSWVAALTRAGFQVTGLDEPVHPQSGRVLSLLLTAAPVNDTPRAAG